MADLTFIISVLQFWQREHSLATAHGLAGNLLAVAMLPLMGHGGLAEGGSSVPKSIIPWTYPPCKLP